MDRTTLQKVKTAEVQHATEPEISSSSQTLWALDKAASMEPNAHLSHAGAHVLCSLDIMTTVFAMLEPQSAIGAQRVFKTWKLFVDNHRDVGFMPPPRHRMKLELPDADAVNNAKYELHPIVKADPAPRGSEYLWKVMVHADRALAGLHPASLAKWITFNLKPSFALGEYSRTPTHSCLPKPSWMKLQIARPWVQHLTFRFMLAAAGGYPPRVVARFEETHVTNPTGITSVEVYDAIVRLCGRYDGLPLTEDGDRVYFVWKILPLPDVEEMANS